MMVRPNTGLTHLVLSYDPNYLVHRLAIKHSAYPKVLHQQIGGYREDAAYGEDHLYARAIKHAQVPQVMVQATVGTSARKYLEHGWISLMLKYQWMWIAQALQDQPSLSRS